MHLPDTLETWDVYDLDDVELRSALSAVLQRVSSGVQDERCAALLPVMQCEVAERQAASSILSGFAAAAAAAAPPPPAEPLHHNRSPQQQPLRHCGAPCFSRRPSGGGGGGGGDGASISDNSISSSPPLHHQQHKQHQQQPLSRAGSTPVLRSPLLEPREGVQVPAPQASSPLLERDWFKGGQCNTTKARSAAMGWFRPQGGTATPDDDREIIYTTILEKTRLNTNRVLPAPGAARRRLRGGAPPPPPPPPPPPQPLLHGGSKSRTPPLLSRGRGAAGAAGPATRSRSATLSTAAPGLGGGGVAGLGRLDTNSAAAAAAAVALVGVVGAAVVWERAGASAVTSAAADACCSAVQAILAASAAERLHALQEEARCNATALLALAGAATASRLSLRHSATAAATAAAVTTAAATAELQRNALLASLHATRLQLQEADEPHCRTAIHQEEAEQRGAMFLHPLPEGVPAGQGGGGGGVCGGNAAQRHQPRGGKEARQRDRGRGAKCAGGGVQAGGGGGGVGAAAEQQPEEGGGVRQACGCDLQAMVARYPSFQSLWAVYDRHCAPAPKPPDEKAAVEEGARDVLAWALSTLDETSSSDDGSNSDDEARPNAPPQRGRQTGWGVAYTLPLQDVLARMRCLLHEGDSRERLSEAAMHMNYVTERRRPEVDYIISEAFRDQELWQRGGTSLCNYMWTWRKPRLPTRYLFVAQRLNHYPGSSALTRKDCLKKLLHRFKRIPGRSGEGFGNIMPETYVLPAECGAFVEATGMTLDRVKLQQLSSTNNKDHTSTTCGTWIVKPIGKSRGRGIEVVTHPAAVPLSEAVVVQRYVPNPLLMQGHKFDLRLYVVVTSFQPLQAHVSRLGFARFSSLPFSMDPASLRNKLIHLTNTSVQGRSVPPSFCDARNLCKWSLDRLSQELPGRSGVPWETTWARITECLVKCLAAADWGISRQECCFELLGFDVLLDEHLRPWVLEVNASPSLEVDTELDAQVKVQLMKDCVGLICPQPFDRLALLEVLCRRLHDLLGRRRHATQGGGKRVLAEDLHAILCPAKYGGPAEPSQGNFEQLAPSPTFDKVSKLMRL